MFASRLQWLFRTAAAVRAGDETAAERLVTYLRGVPDESVEPIIRACSLELQLANIAEERERVRRRRQYDATGAIQRESFAETARDPARPPGRHRAAGRAAADRARAHRPPDGGHAPLGARPPVGRRGAARPPGRPAHRPHAPPRAARRAARGADRLVADRRAAAGAAEGRGRGPAQPVLLRGGPVRRRPGRAGRDRARARRAARAARAQLRLLDRRRHGRPPGGGRGHAGERAAAAPQHRADAAARRAWTGSRACSRTPRCGSRCPRSSRTRWRPTRSSCRARSCCAARTASGSRCARSSGSSTTGSRTRCARAAASPATPTRRRCGATSSSCSRT